MIGDAIQTEAVEITNIHWHNAKSLPMWTVYRPTTKDYPGQWCARLFLTLPDAFRTNIVIVDDTLEQLRNRLPIGLTMLNRDPLDDACIEEVWL